MTISLKHPFESAKGDGLDTTLVQPSDWNAEHTLTLAADKLVGRTTGAGAAEEITCTAAGRSVIAGATLAAIRTVLELTSAATAAATSAGLALLEAASAAAQRTALGLGTSATLDVGTAANKVVQLNGDAKLPAVDGSLLTGIASAGVLKGVQVFSASATYTRTPGCTKAVVIATGGGCGGSGIGSSGGTSGGGGSGETRIAFVTPGSTETVTIGAGGAGGSTSPTPGGNTSFGAHVVANGGTASAGGTGGSGGTSLLSQKGSFGITGEQGGAGGGTFFGPGATMAASSGQDGEHYGAGGSGVYHNTSARTGGNGKSGVVVVLEFA